ncbi:MAG: hypothetical protein IJK44_00680 [Bacteroidales bacterium]|nr:hypothetical protein [Bacteroidales bacterium]
MRTRITMKWMGSMAVVACLLMVAFSCGKIEDKKDEPDNAVSRVSYPIQAIQPKQND